MNSGPFYALVAAGLFGASTPFAKLLVGDLDPWLLAGFLYMGSAIGLGLILFIQSLKQGRFLFKLPRKDWPWLGLATFFGGILGPVFLMYGLTKTTASSASLLLNLEGVLTSSLAWFAFKEHFDRRIVLGMISIVLGGIVLSIPQGSDQASISNLIGPGLIVLACLCWGLDNNFTRKISTSDAIVLTSFKSLIAGTTNLVLAFSFGAQLSAVNIAFKSMSLGFFGYGLSIVMFVLALRNLGASRAGAYFSTAPFIGAILSLVMDPSTLTWNLILAGIFMGVGVWLHLTEDHNHEHTHEHLAHSHPHIHDDHHQHPHEEKTGSSLDGHSHWHVHEPLTHKHKHFPDIHHQHKHDENSESPNI